MILTTSGHLLTVYNIWCSCQDLCCLEKEFLKFLEKVSECMSVARLFYHNNARRTKENLVLHFIFAEEFSSLQNSVKQWNSGKSVFFYFIRRFLFWWLSIKDIIKDFISYHQKKLYCIAALPGRWRLAIINHLSSLFCKSYWIYSFDLRFNLISKQCGKINHQGESNLERNWKNVVIYEIDISIFVPP